MSRYDTSLQAPGLNLRPMDTSSQLVSALGSVFEGTTAAAAASARVQRAKEAEKLRIRREHEQIAQQKFSEAERARIIAEQQGAKVASDKVSDKIYNLLMDPRAENPEWLLQQGIAGVDLSRSDIERDQWQKFTLSQQGAVRRLREETAQEESLNEQRSMRRQFKLMAAQADAGLDVDSLMRDPNNLLENASDYYMTAMLTAAGDDIDDPAIRSLLADTAVEHAISRFQRDLYPRLEQSRQVNQETMGREKINNLTEAFLDGQLSGQDMLSGFTGTMAKEFSNRTPADQMAMTVKFVEGTLNELGRLPNDMTAPEAMAKADELLAAVPSSLLPESERRIYRDQFHADILPRAAKRRAYQEVNLALEGLTKQTNFNGVPKTWDEALIESASSGGPGVPSILDSKMELVLTNLGLDRDNPDHAFAIGAVREQFEAYRGQASQLASQRAKGLGLGVLARNGGITRGKDATAYANEMFLNSQIPSEMDVLEIGSVMEAAGLDPAAFGIVAGQQVDWNEIMQLPQGRDAIQIIAAQQAGLWTRNGNAELPEEFASWFTRLMDAGGEGNLWLLQGVADGLSYHHYGQLEDRMSSNDRFRLSAVRFGDELGLSLGDVQRRLALPDDALTTARANFNLLYGRDPEVIEDSKAIYMKKLEAMTEGIAEGPDGARALLPDSSTSRYFFLEAEVEARALAAADGRTVPSEEDYGTAAASVLNKIKSKGMRVVAFDNVGQFVYDPHGHTSSDLNLRDMWGYQSEAPVTEANKAAVAEAMGVDADDWMISGATTAGELYEGSVRRQLLDSLPPDSTFQDVDMYMKAPISWVPVQPNHPLFGAFMRDANGGVPFRPVIQVVDSNNETQTIDIMDPRDFDGPWPFVGTLRGLQYREESAYGNMQAWAREKERTHAAKWRGTREDLAWLRQGVNWSLLGTRSRLAETRATLQENVRNPSIKPGPPPAPEAIPDNVQVKNEWERALMGSLPPVSAFRMQQYSNLRDPNDRDLEEIYLQAFGVAPPEPTISLERTDRPPPPEPIPAPTWPSYDLSGGEITN